ncbi:MAG: helix-turn-helix domain-containing protein [Nitrospiraceae bacterium]
MATTANVNLDSAAHSDSEILTVMEVARFLRVPKSTVYKLARLGQLPAFDRKHWRFLRRDIHEWMHSRGQQGLSLILPGWKGGGACPIGPWQWV